MAIHTYHECPHVLLELSILPEIEIKDLQAVPNTPNYSTSEDKLDKIFKQISQIPKAGNDVAHEKIAHSVEHNYWLECPDAGLF